MIASPKDDAVCPRVLHTKFRESLVVSPPMLMEPRLYPFVPLRLLTLDVAQGDGR